MLFELKENSLVINKESVVKDFRINIDSFQRLARVKFGIVNSLGTDDIDLALGWRAIDIAKICIFVISLSMIPLPKIVKSESDGIVKLKFTGKELNRDIQFESEVRLNVGDKSIRINLTYDDKITGLPTTINRNVCSVLDIVNVIKTLVTSTN